LDTVDLILIVIGLIVAIDGYRKGFLSQATAILSIFVGVKLSVMCADRLGSWLAGYIDASPQIIKIISFAVIFIAVAILLKLVCLLLEKVLKLIMLGWLNRLLGVFLSVLKYLLIIALIAWVFNAINSKLPIIKTDFLDNSAIYPWIQDFANKVFPSIKELLTNK